jgi:hypothetical protein
MEQRVADQKGIQPGRSVHGTDEQFELYLLNRLPESDLALLEEHLFICAACREKLDGVGDFVLGMREAPRQLLLVTAPAIWPGWRIPSQLGSFFRRPAFSMGLAFATLLIVVAIFSSVGNRFPLRASLQLTATRGEMPFIVPARTLHLMLSDGPREGGPFRVDVLNAMGLSMWAGLADSSPGGVEVNVAQPLPQGDYFVRLYSPAGKMLREYGFRVRP